MSDAPKSVGRPTRLTVQDIAEHAGVSRATVSLVLRKSPLVAALTRAAVLESARALGYVYNRGAASLRNQRTHTIGVAISELTNPYFAELTAAIQRAFMQLGRTVFIANSDENCLQQAKIIATMREYNVDGLAICPAQGTTRETMRELKEHGVPCVLISRDIAGSGLDYAGQANQIGMRAAVEHLIALGHRRIAMVGGGEHFSTGVERWAGYRTALQANGMTVEPDLVVAGETTRSFGASAIRALLATRDPPTAAVCFNDVIAFGVMLGLRQIGLEAGRDFAVTGYDDITEAALWTPALSTVTIDPAGMGAAAARMLLDRIESPDAPRRQTILKPVLTLRESTCPPRHP